MFSQKAFNELLVELKEKNYTGTNSELISSIRTAKLKTECEGIYSYFQQQRQYIDKDKIDNFDHIMTLFEKLTKKYKHRISSDFMSPYAHFYGSEHPTKGYRFTVTMDFKDNTNHGINGYLGTFSVRILYGYDDHRKEQSIILIDKKPC
jgi:hypothetical protein